MILSALCTSDNVKERVDSRIAVADTDEGVNEEAITRKIPIGQEKLEIRMLSKIQLALQPERTYNDKTPRQILATLNAASLEMLRTVAVEWTIYYLFEEGEAKLRFMYEQASEFIGKQTDRKGAIKDQSLDEVWSLLEFDLDGNMTIDDIERSFTNTSSSVRISA